MTDELREHIIENYLYTPFWKRAYNEAPSQACKDYILLGLRGFACNLKGEDLISVGGEREALKKQFDLEDWKHLISLQAIIHLREFVCIE